MSKGPHKCKGMRAFLARGAEDEEGGVVLLGEELERGGVFEGMDFVFLGEFLGEWEVELVQVV